jgi:pyruvate dehydrogenase E2 component (dihydrolipoamide acetyltransferase)
MLEFKLPSLGSDMDQGTLLKWNVGVGQRVRKGDVLAVVDTSKAAIDVECWQDGVVHRLVAEVGQTVPVGSVLALLLAPGEAAPAPGEAAGQVAAPAPAPATPTAAVAAASVGVAAMSPDAQGVASVAPATRARVSPAARARAAELGLDPGRAVGTGIDGAVTREDVERLAVGATAAPLAAAAPVDRAAEMRKSIAAAMSRSKREIPHYYLAETVPMRNALAWLRGANEQREVTRRLLPAVLLLKAVALAVREVPEINGRFADGAFRPSAAAHIGVAISLRHGGLIAPALHDVGSKPLDELMGELADLVKRCRAGSLRSSELSDPTLTVTNLGEQGVEAVYGVIYPPQVALVGFGRIGERPWVDGGVVSAMPALTATLSADHRVSDGHRGALFLARLRELLQRPEDL